MQKITDKAEESHVQKPKQKPMDSEAIKKE
jgi:hypothetical protein